MKRKRRKHFHAWVIWLLSAIFFFYKYLIEVSPSVMTSDLMQAFSIDGLQLGNLAASYYYAYLVMQIPVGLLIDRFGPRKVTTLAIALCALGTLFFGASHLFVLAGFSRFLIGIGAAFAAINCLKLTANWFPPQRFALMTGLLLTVGMLGAAGGQAPLNWFIDTVGWRPAMIEIGITGFVLMILFWLIVRDEAEKKLDVLHTRKKTHFFSGLKLVFKNPQTWALSIFSGFAFAPVTSMGGLWGVPFIVQKYAISHSLASNLISLVFLGFAVGAPFAGYLSDKLGYRKKIMFWGTLAALVLLLIFIYLPFHTPLILGLLLFFYGFFISFFLLAFTMIHEINPPLLTATAIGVMNAFNALFGAFTDPLIGYFLDMGWTGQMFKGIQTFEIGDYHLAFLTLPIYLVIALFMLAFIKETRCKQAYKRIS